MRIQIHVPLDRGRLAKQVRINRKLYGLGMREAAAQIGVSAATLCRIEQAKPMTDESYVLAEMWLSGVKIRPTSDRRKAPSHD